MLFQGNIIFFNFLPVKELASINGLLGDDPVDPEIDLQYTGITSSIATSGECWHFHFQE
jgi:hypothetical protein